MTGGEKVIIVALLAAYIPVMLSIMTIDNKISKILDLLTKENKEGK